MDQTVLVNQAQALTRRLDATKARPRAVMWVHQPDTDTWRLWIVPDKAISDKREFYRIVAETITKNYPEMHGLDVGATEFIKADHPAIKGMGRALKMPGIGVAQFSGNRFNGYYLPDGIVIRMDL
ncbi:hypothetical protein [Mesorhizobium sp. Mes31]|uniref:hypothetical protein n=1 Tax=Mesorhizobium sp. Mes31 TaxID=2926017 RepID=UPI0021184335|nr:hypothetical protein [Mesorhizobium sp. Mes31]